MIMTDQDQDGSHIKGLLINYLHHFWPSLLKVPGFLTEFITPIVKVSNVSNVLLADSCVVGQKRKERSSFLHFARVYQLEEGSG